MTARPDFTHTSPYFIRESRPAPLTMTDAEIEAEADELFGRPSIRPAIFGPDEGPIYYRPAPTWRERLRAFWGGVWHS